MVPIFFVGGRSSGKTSKLMRIVKYNKNSLVIVLRKENYSGLVPKDSIITYSQANRDMRRFLIGKDIKFILFDDFFLTNNYDELLSKLNSYAKNKNIKIIIATSLNNIMDFNYINRNGVYQHLSEEYRVVHHQHFHETIKIPEFLMKKYNIYY